MDTDVLRTYTPATPPSIKGGEQRHLSQELAKISVSIALLKEVMEQLEARLVAGGL